MAVSSLDLIDVTAAEVLVDKIAHTRSGLLPLLRRCIRMLHDAPFLGGSRWCGR